MQCFKCKRSIATTAAACECNKLFHPGCIKIFALTKYADHCCKALAAQQDLPTTPLADKCTQSLNFEDMATPTDMKSQSTDALFLSIMSKIEESDKKMTALMEDQRSKTEESNNKLTAFIEDQREINREINDKLSKLNCIVETVAHNSQRITKLEQASSTQARDIQALKTAQPIAHTEEENKLIISGLPEALSITPTELVNNIFSALDSRNLSSHVIDVRSMKRRLQSGATPSRSSNAGSLGSIVVTLSSGAVRDAIIAKKRAKRVLKQRDVCGNDSDRNLYVNEMLLKATYDLLQHAKRVAKEKSYKYVWIKQGRICVRSSDSTPIIYIDSMENLTDLV
ncbi:uncharacterized protein LOC112459578 [Temnothorax curvispinosus]|uniref:Uncharacterized protein LOC112459578 n=1 Tax=Temnothorax curvispinosus TaxID=300111 RepID=A0A6J1QB25_9HYME|nr:uncharacterized protein LOC112459578 [Temnothorax curvispinosus]